MESWIWGIGEAFFLSTGNSTFCGIDIVEDFAAIQGVGNAPSCLVWYVWVFFRESMLLCYWCYSFITS